MKITIACVGKIKEKYFSDAVEEYKKRLSRYVDISIKEVADEKAPDSLSAAQENEVKQKEGERLLKVIPPSSYKIALEIDGKQYDSVSFSAFTEQLKTRGISHITFIIGGSLGIGNNVKADTKISFSKMTFPHQLMRVILLEQIYRAQRISNNEPYHK